MALKRGEDASGVDRKATYAVAFFSAVELYGHQGLSRFCLPVGLPLIVGTLVIIHICEVDSTHAMSDGRQGDQTGAVGCAQGIDDLLQQSKMTHVIDA